VVIPFWWLLAGAWNVIWVRLGCSLKFIVSFDMDQAVFWVQSFLQLLYLDIIHPRYCCCPMVCRTKIFVFEFQTGIAKIVCRTSFSYGMIFVSLNSNTTGVTGGAGSAYPSAAYVFTCSFCVGSCYSIFFFVQCFVSRSLFFCFFFFWPLSVLPFTASVYHFGIFRLCLSSSFWFSIALTLDIKYKIL
jgi:hypothetical protein